MSDEMPSKPRAAEPAARMGSIQQASADFGSRFAAFMIDGLLLFGAQWALVIVASRQLQAVGLTSTSVCGTDGFTGESVFCEGPTTGVWALLLAFLLVSTVAYYAVFEGRYGATPGKRWQGLLVVDEGGDWPIGGTRGFLRSMIRQMLFLLPFFLLDASPLAIAAPPILALLLVCGAAGALLMAAFRRDGRGAHDFVAGTCVVRSDTLQSAGTADSGIVPDITTSS